MDCGGCGGVCCKLMIIKFTGELSDDYCKARGIKTINQRMVFDYQCQYLTSDGLCKIHTNKPQACKDFKPGCKDCLLARFISKSNGIIK